MPHLDTHDTRLRTLSAPQRHDPHLLDYALAQQHPDDSAPIGLTWALWLVLAALAAGCTWLFWLT